MKSLLKSHSTCVYISLIASLVSSSAILLCIVAELNSLPWFAIPISLIFWLVLGVEQFFIWNANYALKERAKNGEKITEGRIGLLSLFKTKHGKISDIIFLASFVLYVILYLLSIGEDTFQFILLFLIVLSFRTHCILNGKNYLNIKK